MKGSQLCQLQQSRFQLKVTAELLQAWTLLGNAAAHPFIQLARPDNIALFRSTCCFGFLCCCCC